MQEKGVFFNSWIFILFIYVLSFHFGSEHLYFDTRGGADVTFKMEGPGH